MEQQALAALAASMREFRGGPQRVVVTGLSMGGAGAWYMARHYGRFAAIVPICGEVTRRVDEPFPTSLPPDLARIIGARDPYSRLAAAIGRTPVWAFHGEFDDTIPVTQSRRMTAALRAIGAEVQYTEYPGVDHYSWDRAYADERLAQWIASKRLRDSVDIQR
jgi:predicted peptidase